MGISSHFSLQFFSHSHPPPPGFRHFSATCRGCSCFVFSDIMIISHPPPHFPPSFPIFPRHLRGLGDFGFGYLQGGGNFAAGLFRRGIFRISNSCEISHVIFRPLCEINPLRNLAKCLVCCALPQELKQRNVAVRICNGGSCDRTFLIAVRKVHLQILPAACYILCRDGK